MSDEPKNSSKESERVTRHDQRGHGCETFRKVTITYADGSPFFQGWIQIFKKDDDCRNGPTIFPMNYMDYRLDPDKAHRREEFWTVSEPSGENASYREATEADLDQIIDLRFQSYFDDGYERISSYQGLRHIISADFLTIVYEVERTLLGLIYVRLNDGRHPKEAYIDTWFCAPGVRRRGVGAHLLKSVLKKLKELHFLGVYAEIMGSEEHCAEVRQAFESCGFFVGPSKVDASGTLTVEMRRRL